jgi:hypothetical protein
MSFVQSGIRTLASTGGALSTLQIKNHDALASLVLHRATRQDMNKLVEVANMTEALAWLGMGQMWEVEISAGQDAVLAIAKRGASGSQFQASMAELEALREMLEVHDAQLELATVQQIERGIDRITEVKRNKRARKIAA